MNSLLRAACDRVNWQQVAAAVFAAAFLDADRDGDCYFGVCPTCGCTDGYLNVRRAHYFVCHRHRVRWLAGENLFSSWRAESTSDWQAHWERISNDADVAPSYPDSGERHDRQ
jgi:hypothetical protein